MKLKGLALFLVVVLVAGLSVSAFAATNPFSDVPADHWAYDSIVKLAAVGLVEGYPDGTYGGSRMLTRYEAAMVFARTLARLESLVESGVASETAGVKDQIRAEVLREVLAEIEATKAGLEQFVKDEFAKIEIPVVEAETVTEKVVEKVVVEQPIEKIVERQPIERPFVMTPEAEKVIGDLVTELAQKHLDAAELGVKETVVETKILERVVEAENAVTEEQVRAIVEELLAHQLSGVEVDVDRALQENLSQTVRIDDLEKRINDRLRALENGQEALEGDIAYVEYRVLGLIDGVRDNLAALEEGLNSKIDEVSAEIAALTEEFEMELSLIGVRIDELETVFAGLESRVTALEEDHSALKKAFERVTFSGTLNFDADKTVVVNGDPAGEESILGEEYEESALEFSQALDLQLSVKASDTVTVNAFLDADLTLGSGNEIAPNNYGLEILSSTPITRAVVGSLDKDEIGGRFATKSLNSGKRPTLGLLGDYEIGSLTGSLLAGKKEDSDGVVAGNFKFAFLPELGVKGTAVSIYDDVDDQFEIVSGSVGAFGEMVGVEYDVDYVLDRFGGKDTDNTRVDVTLGTEVGPLSLSGAWSKVADDFDSEFVTRGLVRSTNETRLELNASAEVLGMNIGADWYREGTEADPENIQATRVTAAYEFDLFLPFEVSGTIAQNKAAVEPDHRELKVAIKDLELGSTNLTVGSSFAVVRNRIDDNWKNPDHYTAVDVNILTADLGYATTVGGADLTLGYGYQLALPQATGALNETTHTFEAGYGFTDNMSLNLSAERFSNSAEDVAEKVLVNKLSAGVEFKF